MQIVSCIVITECVGFIMLRKKMKRNQPFFSWPLPKAGRELQTALNSMMKNDGGGGGGGGPLAKNQPEASPRAVSQL